MLAIRRCHRGCGAPVTSTAGRARPEIVDQAMSVSLASRRRASGRKVTARLYPTLASPEITASLEVCAASEVEFGGPGTFPDLSIMASRRRSGCREGHLCIVRDAGGRPTAVVVVERRPGRAKPSAVLRRRTRHDVDDCSLSFRCPLEAVGVSVRRDPRSIEAELLGEGRHDAPHRVGIGTYVDRSVDIGGHPWGDGAVLEAVQEDHLTADHGPRARQPVGKLADRRPHLGAGAAERGERDGVPVESWDQRLTPGSNRCRSRSSDQIRPASRRDLTSPFSMRSKATTAGPARSSVNGQVTCGTRMITLASVDARCAWWRAANPSRASAGR